MAVFEEDDRPRPPPRFQPPVMDRWSVEEVRDYITDLQAEIARAEAAIAAKQAQIKAAASFFRTP